MTTMRWIVLGLCLMGLGMAPATAAMATPQAPAVTYDRGILHIYQGARRLATLRVEIARTYAARMQGLMYRTSLPEDAGMLFVFEEDTTGGFWMKNTLIPLSIGFIGRDWRLQEVLDMPVAPDPEKGPFVVYTPVRPYRYALEVNQGYFKRKGIEPGARFELVTGK
jgi:uncharacterized membrane protein (UPF0127 family)